MRRFGKRLGKIAVPVLLALVVLGLVGLRSGFLMTGQQLPDDASRWGKSLSGGVEITVADTRAYDGRYVVLGTWHEGQEACMLSYKRLGLLPLYRRDLQTTSDMGSEGLTGIGFSLDGNRVELMMSPPYTDILKRGEDGVLRPAPATIK